MELLVEKLLSQQNRKSTVKTYMNIWRQFNKFVMNLDVIPPTWQARTTLYIAYLIEDGKQSSSIKSYISAIKKLVMMDGYKWKDEDVLLNSLTKACKLLNDKARTRLPIHCSLLEMILFELERKFLNQIYLECLYNSMFMLCYYGMMRVGEVTKSPHALKAKNVHLATNKDKLLLVLYSSKTHDKSKRPQKIKITSNRLDVKTEIFVHRHFCPFKILRQYLRLRGNYQEDQEQFLIFRDRQPVMAQHVS